MTATTKFYTAFFIALALVVALSFYVGFRAGSSSHDRGAATHRKAASFAP